MVFPRAETFLIEFLHPTFREGGWGLMDFFFLSSLLSKHRNELSEALCIFCMCVFCVSIYLCWCEQMTTDFALTTGLHGFKSSSDLS